MAVLALMYHRTPRGDVTSDWEVPIHALRDQMKALRDAGFRFVDFKDCRDDRYFGRETFISVTLDDGHASNLDAIDLLHDADIPATLFIISRYSRDESPGYMTTRQIADAAGRCGFGGHSATHADLTSLSARDLAWELADSKSYLEDTLQKQITTMSAPGGRIDRRVVAEAERCGYRVIANSVELINVSPANPLSRVCVRLHHSPQDLVDLARAPPMYWMKRRVRRLVGGAIARPLERLSPGLLQAIRQRVPRA